MLPTQDVEAFSQFAQGRTMYEAYLGSGHGNELREARECFGLASARDPNFDLAALYLAVTETELRDADAAIATLTGLVERNTPFLPEAHVQLAYAYTKRYQDTDYQLAEQHLRAARTAAQQKKRFDQIALIDAYSAFVHAVRGGRSNEPEPAKRSTLLQSLSESAKLLDASQKAGDAETDVSVRFEALNARGVAFMWLGRLFPYDPAPESAWANAEQAFREALHLRPSSVRVQQNLGTLRMFQGDRLKESGNLEAALQRYEEAKRFVKQSLLLNRFDQFPHYRMAVLSAKTGDWQEASKYIETGRRQNGAVSEERWAALTRIIQTQDRGAAEHFE